MIAIFAAIVIAFLDRDSFYESLPHLWSLSVAYTAWLMAVVVLPIAAAVYPVAILWTFCRSLASLCLESLNDDFLSRRGFYDFINGLLDMDDRSEKRLLMRTTGRVYALLRILSADVRDVPKLYRNLRRAVRLARRR